MQPGLGVLINQMSDRGSAVLEKSLGKTIAKVFLKDDDLKFKFTDGTGMKIYDGGQSCCESRWMHTDDELNHFEGATFLNAEVRDGGDVDETEYKKITKNEWGPESCQSQFLIITTSTGTFTVVNYVDHNGYYGGFSMNVEADNE